MSLIRIKNGTLRKGDKIKVMSTGRVYNADRLGIFTPKQVDKEILRCGEAGWVVCAIKDILGAPVGDTLTGARAPADKPLPGFKKSNRRSMRVCSRSALTTMKPSVMLWVN